MPKRPTLLDKKMVLRSINLMPDQFSLDELLDRLILIEKITAGMADLEAGRTISLAEAKICFAQWL